VNNTVNVNGFADNFIDDSIFFTVDLEIIGDIEQLEFMGYVPPFGQLR